MSQEKLSRTLCSSHHPFWMKGRGESYLFFHPQAMHDPLWRGLWYSGFRVTGVYICLWWPRNLMHWCTIKSHCLYNLIEDVSVNIAFNIYKCYTSHHYLEANLLLIFTSNVYYRINFVIWMCWTSSLLLVQIVVCANANIYRVYIPNIYTSCPADYIYMNVIFQLVLCNGRLMLKLYIHIYCANSSAEICHFYIALLTSILILCLCKMQLFIDKTYIWCNSGLCPQ